MQTSVVLRPTKRSDHHGVAEHRQLWRWSVDPSGRQGCLMYINRVLKCCLLYFYRLGAYPFRRLSRESAHGGVSPVAVCPAEGPLTDSTAGAQPRQQEPVFMPPFAIPGGGPERQEIRGGGSVKHQHRRQAAGTTLPRSGPRVPIPPVVEKPTQPVRELLRP
jgi:hypothetical protein